MLEWIERKFKSAYLKLLEAEVERLREDNRQLVNSLLASHGMQQIDAPRSKQPFQPIKRPPWSVWARNMERKAAQAKINEFRERVERFNQEQKPKENAGA